MIALLLGTWVGGRVLAWESPLVLAPAPALLVRGADERADALPVPVPMPAPARMAIGPGRRLTGAMSYADPSRDPLFAASMRAGMGAGMGGSMGAVMPPWGAPGEPRVRYVMVPALPPRWAYAAPGRGPLAGRRGRYPQTRMAPAPAGEAPAARGFAAAPVLLRIDPVLAGEAAYLRQLGPISGDDLRLARTQDPLGAPGAVPFGGPAGKVRRAAVDRWSLDAWSFLRQGSDAAPISQGRVPIYGASQVGAIAQWRAAPASRFDPRLYARAYQALVANGETEFAAGGSIRPLPGLPLRAAGEVRVTQSPFATDVRPAGYIFTELPPFTMVEKVSGELYAGGGYVGGQAATGFVDAQFALTRPLIAYTPSGGRELRLSVGAGAWGGAQEGAHRLDLGPTMRLEMLLGRVPARVSVDWRERVTGDAAPESGVAATVSASF